MGPAAVGKSCVRAMACLQEPDFHFVRPFTTRSKQARDTPGAYRFLPHTEPTFQQLGQKMATGDLVNITVRPTTGFVYGSEIEEYSAPYNLLDMIYSNAAWFRKLPFGRCVAIGIAVEPTAWHDWFLERFRQTGELPDALKRLIEGEASLNWLLGQGDNMRWLHNQPDKLGASMQKLIAMVREGAPSSPEARELGRAMLESIPDLRTSLGQTA